MAITLPTNKRFLKALGLLLVIGLVAALAASTFRSKRAEELVTTELAKQISAAADKLDAKVKDSDGGKFYFLRTNSAQRQQAVEIRTLGNGKDKQVDILASFGGKASPYRLFLNGKRYASILGTSGQDAELTAAMFDAGSNKQWAELGTEEGKTSYPDNFPSLSESAKALAKLIPSADIREGDFRTFGGTLAAIKKDSLSGLLDRDYIGPIKVTFATSDDGVLLGFTISAPTQGNIVSAGSDAGQISILSYIADPDAFKKVNLEGAGSLENADSVKSAMGSRGAWTELVLSGKRAFTTAVQLGISEAQSQKADVLGYEGLGNRLGTVKSVLGAIQLIASGGDEGLLTSADGKRVCIPLGVVTTLTPKDLQPEVFFNSCPSNR